MIQLEPEIENEISEFINDTWGFFARWDNGEIALDQIERLDSRELDDRILVNDRVPGTIWTTNAFRELFPSMHGRYAHDPVSPRIDLLFAGQLAPNVYVATYRQHYDFESGSTASRVITEILVRIDDQLRIQYVHE